MPAARQTKTDEIFDIVNHIFMFFLLLIVLLPLIFILSASISDPDAVNSGQVFLFPRGLNFEGYLRIFSNKDIWTGYKNTMIYTVVGVAINLFMTITAAYPLSRKEFSIRKPITMLFIFTMFFNGGLIPTYLLIKNLGMLNRIWAIVIPNAVSIWNVIITRTYFQSTIPQELYDAAEIDGCSNMKLLTKVVLPLSRPIIAVMALFYGVNHWNEFFSALLFLSDEYKYPLQLILRAILIQNQINEGMMMGNEVFDLMEQMKIAEMLKYGMIIVGSLPVLIAYPFVQKHFVKGIMIGSVKG